MSIRCVMVTMIVPKQKHQMAAKRRMIVIMVSKVFKRGWLWFLWVNYSIFLSIQSHNTLWVCKSYEIANLSTRRYCCCCYIHHYVIGSGATETTSTSTTEKSSTSTRVNTSTAADVSSTTDSIVVPEEVSTELNETVSGVQDAVNNTLAELSSVSANITDPGLLSNITDLEDSIGELGNLLTGSNLLGGLGRFKRGAGLLSKRIQNDKI